MWKTALKAGADIVTITSYNEWQEGRRSSRPASQSGKPSYEGAWGKTGLAAQRAYLAATTEWTARLAAPPRRGAARPPATPSRPASRPGREADGWDPRETIRSRLCAGR